MPLSSSTRLGPYETQAAIVAGGTGEFYTGPDACPDRSVAIRVLPRGGADDPERLRCFEQEACAVAALIHPNVCALHGIGCEVPRAPDGRRRCRCVLGHAAPGRETLAAAAARGAARGSC